MVIMIIILILMILMMIIMMATMTKVLLIFPELIPGVDKSRRIKPKAMLTIDNVHIIIYDMMVNDHLHPSLNDTVCR